MALHRNISAPIPADSVPFSVFSLMVWGSPGSFGVSDKETRIAAIGAWIAQDTEHDVWLLNDLWMRPDHDTIKSLLPEGRPLEPPGRNQSMLTFLFQITT